MSKEKEIMNTQKKPKCFGNFSHKDFCFNEKRQRARKCKWVNECFDIVARTRYFSKHSETCEECIRQGCKHPRQTHTYIVEPMECWRIEINHYVPSLTKTSRFHVEFLTHWLCDAHMKELKLYEKLEVEG